LYFLQNLGCVGRMKWGLRCSLFLLWHTAARSLYSWSYNEYKHQKLSIMSICLRLFNLADTFAFVAVMQLFLFNKS
jgi:hypothetical protein